VARVVSVDSSSAVERPRRPFSNAPRPPRRAPPDLSNAVTLEGRVKWFNETKGFGFVAVEDGGKDIFVHISALNAAGIAHLDEGQPVNMRVVDTPRGREAVSIAL
jgi:CspA family cold shock protein